MNQLPSTPSPIEHYRSYNASFSNQLYSCLKSPLIMLLAFAIASYTFYAFFPMVGSFLGALTLIGATYNWEKLAYEFLLTINVAKNFFWKWSWWHEIEKNILLGAIPLRFLDHEKMLKQLGITAILAGLKQHEYTTYSIFGLPVDPKSWGKSGIDYLHIETGDFSMPSNKVLLQAARYIDKKVKEKKRIYIHCKSGIARSFSFYAAYKILKGEDLDKIWKEVHEIRPYIVSKKSFSMVRLKGFQKYLQKRH